MTSPDEEGCTRRRGEEECFSPPDRGPEVFVTREITRSRGNNGLLGNARLIPQVLKESKDAYIV